MQWCRCEMEVGKRDYTRITVVHRKIVVRYRRTF